VVGSASLRRQAQILAKYPTLKVNRKLLFCCLCLLSPKVLAVESAQILAMRKFDYFDPATAHHVRHAALFFGGASRAAFALTPGLAYMAPAYTLDRPARRAVIYVDDTLTGQAWWEVGGNEPGLDRHAESDVISNQQVNAWHLQASHERIELIVLDCDAAAEGRL